MITEVITPTLESKERVEKFFGVPLPEKLTWKEMMALVIMIEDLDYNSRMTSTYSVVIAKRGSDIQPNIWAGDRWLIRRNVNDNRLSNTWSVIVEFVTRYKELSWKES
jgi:hypothetical protein